ncbi:MAG: hypothetical protein JHC54_05750 [Acinetobacter sp.]|nr:hypothetical protein [Acinetobacter sp.]
MKHISIIAILILLATSTQAQRQRYKITQTKLAVWTMMGAGGVAWGAREAMYADAKVFERHFGAKPYGFWGSEQWQTKYAGGRYQAADGTRNRMKTQVIGNFGRDYWHTSKYVVFAWGVTGTFVIGNSKQPMKHKLLDLLIGSAIFSGTSTFSYQMLRR